MKSKYLTILLALVYSTAYAQSPFKNKALAIGELAHIYNAAGAQPEYWNGESDEGGEGLHYPAIYRTPLLRADALWVGVRNVKDENGNSYDVRVVHVGPRVTGVGEVFPVEFKTISKFEPPQVIVDGNESFYLPTDNDGVDPNLPADRVIINKVNTLLGITITRRIYAYSKIGYDNFHIQEYVLTNTGNTDEDPEIELNQTLQDVYLHFQKRYTYRTKNESPGGGWGANVMNDIVGDGMQDYEVDFRAQYTWLGNYLNSDPFDDLGSPQWSNAHWWAQPPDSIGRLTTPQFIGTVTLHADKDITDRSDDPEQPKMTGSIDADDPITSQNDAYNLEKMRAEYDFISGGRFIRQNGSTHEYPHHADRVDLDGNFLTPDGDPMIGKAGGWTSAFSYGPYTLAPGDSIKIVIAEAVDGLSMKEAAIIGRQFKIAANHQKRNATTQLALTPNIAYDANGDGIIDPETEVKGKNEWWWSGRDSLFQTFEKALEVYRNSNGLKTYPFEEPPRPPSRFEVTSGVDRITLSWDAHVPPGGHIEIYRSANYIEGELIVDRDDDIWDDKYFEYTCVAGCPGTPQITGNTFEDTNVSRGINYYYYIQVVDANGNRSNRYWTQTYDPVRLLRPPGETTSSFQIVPNPFNIAADEVVRWPGPKREQIAFLDIPGRCIIRIYTERGDLVKTIEHLDGSGDEYWDLTTDSKQVVVSGIYIAIVENLDTKEVSYKKFVIIR